MAMSKIEKMELKNEKAKRGAKGSAFWGILIFALLLFIDQATKVLADYYFNEYAPEAGNIQLVPNVIEFTISYNRDIAFNLLKDLDPSIMMWVVMGTAAIMAIVAIFYFAIDGRRRFLRTALVFIIAGGIGNFIDRVYFQVWDPATTMGVRDMVLLDFSSFFNQWFGWENFMNFGVCNFADFFIVIGGIMMILAFLFFDRDALLPAGKYKTFAREYDAEQAAKKAAKAQAKADKAKAKADKAAAKAGIYVE
jgi:lipoprotein signal peptidase